MRLRASTLPIIVIGLVLSCPITEAQPPQLHPQFLGAFFPGRMNEAGQIIGSATVAGNSRGFVVNPGQPQYYLPLPGGMASSWALDINDLGVVVGVTGPAYSPEFSGVAIAWDPDGQGGYTYRLLGALPGQSQGRATAINNLGDIVGYSTDGTYRYAVLFNGPNGVLNLNGLGVFDPTDINDQRVLVDNSFTVKRLDLDTMVVEDLGHPAGSYLATRSVRINEAGQVAGQAIRSNGGNSDREAARYTDGIGWEVFSPPGPWNAVSDMNEQSDMVLTIYTESYVRYQGDATYLLESLIVNDVGYWEVGYNFGLTMNSAGWIAVYASNSTTGQSGTLLLRPDDPAAVGDLALATAQSLLVSPNPFGGTARIRFELPQSTPFLLDMIDAAGRVVRHVAHEAPASVGLHEVEWDGRDDAGRVAGPGVYFARLATSGGVRMGKVVRVR